MNKLNELNDQLIINIIFPQIRFMCKTIDLVTIDQIMIFLTQLHPFIQHK